MELILAPMVLDGKEAVGSMGDDTPLAVLSRQYRGLHHFFRQQFSQVTNPPIDPLREWRVMSLKTRFGNLGNIFDEDPSQTRILAAREPGADEHASSQARRRLFRRRHPHHRLHLRAAPEASLREALERIRQEAEDAVRGGCADLVLSDERSGAERAPIPMILAAGAVHSHLVRQGLRAFSSITVRSGECLDIHYFAVLIGVGATAGQRLSGRGRDRRPPRPRPVPGPDARGVPRPLQGGDQPGPAQDDVQDGHLDHPSPIAAATISRPIGLSRSLCREYFPGLITRISGIGLTGIQKRVVELHGQGLAEGEPPVLAIGGFYRYRRGGEAMPTRRG